LFISNEKDFEVAQVVMTSLHLNSREVSKTAINVMGALQFIQSQCRCCTDDPQPERIEVNKSTVALLFQKQRACQPVNGNNDGGRAETEEPACFQYHTD